MNGIFASDDERLVAVRSIREIIFKNTTLNIDYSHLRKTFFSNTECTEPARHLHEKTLHSFSQRIFCTAKSFGHLSRIFEGLMIP